MNIEFQDHSKRAFTLIELLIVIVIIGILFALVIPLAKNLTSQAGVPKCISHQKKLFSAILSYSNDNNAALPPFREDVVTKSFWFDLISPYYSEVDRGAQGFAPCPAAKPDQGSVTYGVNYHLIFGMASSMGTRKLASIPSSTFLFGDSESNIIYTPQNWHLNADPKNDGFPTSNGAFSVPYNYFSPRHPHGGVMTFADGSARNVTVREWAKNENNLWGPQP